MHKKKKFIWRGSKCQRYADINRWHPTSAMRKFENILNELGDGALKDKFIREWAFKGRWILDFFFYENRLGIEIDGSIHNKNAQIIKDREKDHACKDFGITLIRFKNQEVFGDHKKLINKLRHAYKLANKNVKIFRKKEVIKEN